MTFACILCQGLFAMAEMACISYPRVRLYYQASHGNRGAQWVLDLLHHPARLFGTTLLLVNFGLQCGSESARQFYASMGWDPDWAPLTQAPLVIMLGELAPLFAARRAPEAVVRGLAPLLAAAAWALRPATWILNGVATGLTRLFRGSQPEAALSLSREELQRAFEETSDGGDVALNRFINHLFALRHQVATDLMRPLKHSLIVQGSLPIDQVRALMVEMPVEEVLLYQKLPRQVTGVALTRELLQYRGDQPIQVAARTPWVVPAQMPALQVFRQFQQGRSGLAVVLSPQGIAMGTISLEELLPVLFPTEVEEESTTVVERTFPGEFRVGLFNQLYEAALPHPEWSLAELVAQELGHSPCAGDLVRVAGFELKVLEAGIGGVARVQVHSAN